MTPMQHRNNDDAMSHHWHYVPYFDVAWVSGPRFSFEKNKLLFEIKSKAMAFLQTRQITILDQIDVHWFLFDLKKVSLIRYPNLLSMRKKTYIAFIVHAMSHHWYIYIYIYILFRCCMGVMTPISIWKKIKFLFWIL